MKAFVAWLCCLLLVLLTGCTAAEMNAMNQLSQGLEELSDQYQQGTAQIMNNSSQLYPNTKPQPVAPEIEPFNKYERARQYLINTGGGLERTECMTLSDGYTFCY